LTADAAGDDFVALIRDGKLAEAEAECRRRLAQRPGHPETLNNLANVLEDLGRPDEAETVYGQAIAARPDFAEAHYNLGLLLQRRRRLDEAEHAYRHALELRPQLFLAHNNLGAALRDQRRPREALAAFDAALRLRPDYADAHLNQAMCRLQLGDFTEGWVQYEWRWRTPQAASEEPHRFSQPPWLGREAVAGKTILLHAEQGFGDTLQFCRYAPAVAALGARVILEVQPGLERLLRRLDGVAEVVSRGAPLPPFDLRTPLMSLPLALGARVEDADACVPYLTADPRDVAGWAARLGPARGLRVGLVWAGAPRPGALAAATDERRSFPLETFAPLAAPEGVQFFSLQKGLAAEQLTQARQNGWAGPQIVDHTAELHDFADTAAFVANLDLVVTCDTSVAHLVGAIGKPVWILSRFDGCWRWLFGRDDTPWYPNARLFRQDAPGDWAGVVDRVVVALAEMAG
jgi:tetratricopeptide (TPR) repeat protein